MNKRHRGRNRRPNNNNPNRSLDSNGPDVKVRGSASTIYEKYTSLARDAQAGGHRVKAENYLQHAEHYLRLMNVQLAQQAARAEAQAAERAQRQAQQQKETGDAGDADESTDAHGKAGSGPSDTDGKPRRSRYPRRRDETSAHKESQGENGGAQNNEPANANSDGEVKAKKPRKKNEAVKPAPEPEDVTAAE